MLTPVTPPRRHQPSPSEAHAVKEPAPTLIVLTSFFPESRRALRFAAELAGPLAAPLVLLHLDAMAAQYPNEPVDTTPADLRELRHDLQQLADELPRPATIELASGRLSRVLADMAQRHAPALFVLGRPADEQADFELSEAIVAELRAAHLPLLLVPEVYAGPDRPQHLAVATDDEPFVLHAGARAAQLLLRQLMPGQVTVVTASPLQDDNVCAAALHHVRTSGLLPAPGPVPTVEGFYATQTEQGLLHAIATTQADWLVLLAHPRRYLDQLLHHSITKRMLHWSPVPVLVVPSQTSRRRAPKRPTQLDNGFLI
ncbi:universal stress protein [Microvirga sp. STS02]|uniref:universal stress protein n=1 Tax=Hymenobacter negativus TaxID=2795026 RepID=UPI0018DE26E4|nr:MULTISPECIES: universal stress protein [Bacteria]MBH8568639.1 universal stress protein [Hymenobacter negativus]MBR7208373.1 universal stress protein [Microvirga sp. STS02]